MILKLYELSVVLHILAATIWIGGMIFLVLVLVPTVRRLPSRDLGVALVRDTGRRFRVVGWVCLLTLVATGISNLLCRGVGPDQWFDPAFWAGPFGQTLARKLLLVGGILTISAVHDFDVGPMASRLLAEQPQDPRALRYRRAATWLGRLNLLFALGVVALAVMLVRGRPW